MNHYPAISNLTMFPPATFVRSLCPLDTSGENSYMRKLWLRKMIHNTHAINNIKATSIHKFEINSTAFPWVFGRQSSIRTGMNDYSKKPIDYL